MLVMLVVHFNGLNFTATLSVEINFWACKAESESNGIGNSTNALNRLTDMPTERKR
ncbi:hypothetical protein SCLCIDRAFT_1215319 [Scleroderma citrinum Foug A]|uniref:Uncharacterized protein n=1 Tax=Scleroderma citrinum Foug A TaxID=1036808 RepID=A0A0C3ABF5_9AGAM|nr:hypothetical protein SCLCIDRAFT_1215319 [Scleroderma citrinum Foug A]